MGTMASMGFTLQAKLKLMNAIKSSPFKDQIRISWTRKNCRVPRDREVALHMLCSSTQVSQCVCVCIPLCMRCTLCMRHAYVFGKSISMWVSSNPVCACVLAYIPLCTRCKPMRACVFGKCISGRVIYTVLQKGI